MYSLEMETQNNTAAKMTTVRITTRYGAGTYVLEIGGRVVGCVSRIFGCKAWLCDSARGGGFQTLPAHEGSLHSALRFVMAEA